MHISECSNNCFSTCVTVAGLEGPFCYDVFYVVPVCFVFNCIFDSSLIYIKLLFK